MMEKFRYVFDNFFFFYPHEENKNQINLNKYLTWKYAEVFGMAAWV